MNRLPEKTNSIWQKEVKSFGYALAGLWAVRHERHLQIHIAVAVAVIVAGSVVKLSGAEWCLVVFAIGLVITAEIFNSALEKLTDLASPQYHPLAGKVKDIAAGAVLVAAVTAAGIGFIIFLPKLIALVK